VHVSGTGRGHGVGLCQRGAVGMARSGQNFRAILTYYFPNTTIETLR
jgi:stage II sporulation protein D